MDESTFTRISQDPPISPEPVDIPKKSHSGIIALIVIIILLGGWIAVAFTQGYFPATLFNSKEKKIIDASAELSCYQYTNKLRPQDLLAQRAAGATVTAKTTQEAQEKIATFAEQNAKDFGFASSSEINNYMLDVLKNKKEEAYKDLLKKIDDAAFKKCSVPPASS